MGVDKCSACNHAVSDFGFWPCCRLFCPACGLPQWSRSPLRPRQCRCHQGAFRRSRRSRSCSQPLLHPCPGTCSSCGPPPPPCPPPWLVLLMSTLQLLLSTALLSTVARRDLLEVMVERDLLEVMEERDLPEVMVERDLPTPNS